jgi:hypothetical protein
MSDAFAPDISLSRSLVEPKLFGSIFAAPSFWTWRTVGKLIDGVDLVERRELDLFKQCTGRTTLPNRHDRRVLRRLIVLVGRRGGKDRFFSAVAVWRAALCADWRKHQSAGEGAVVILLGRDKKQAAILRRYCEGLLQAPALSRLVKRETRDVIEFRNGGSLEIASNDPALVRGRSAVAVLGSEAGHWRHDEASAANDEEVVAGAEPSMAMCPDGGLLLLGSSVYRKRGYMYRMHRQLFGHDDSDDLCWFAPSVVMNPKLPQRVIDAALANDPQKARAEYQNAWREDVADFLPVDVIEACTDFGIRERPPIPGTVYLCFVDAAGGTGQDSYALAIVHAEADGTIVTDATREWKPPFVPEQVIAAAAPLLRSYGITEASGDGYAYGFHANEWRKLNFSMPKPYKDKSDNYLTVLPALLAKRVRFNDDATLRSQLAALERKPGSAKETVGHPNHAGAHDDVSDAVCGAIATLLRRAAFDEKITFVSPGVVHADGSITTPSGRPLGSTSPLPSSGVGRHYGEGSSSDFRSYVGPASTGGMISPYPRGDWPWS